jgi:hypothetical protein
MIIALCLNTWTIIQIGYENENVSKGIDFTLKKYVDVETGKFIENYYIIIRFQRLYQHYYKEVGSNKAKLQSEILELIKTDDSYYGEKSNVRFNKAPDEIEKENNDKPKLFNRKNDIFNKFILR